LDYFRALDAYAGNFRVRVRGRSRQSAAEIVREFPSAINLQEKGKFVAPNAVWFRAEISSRSL